MNLLEFLSSEYIRFERSLLVLLSLTNVDYYFIGGRLVAGLFFGRLANYSTFLLNSFMMIYVCKCVVVCSECKNQIFQFMFGKFVVSGSSIFKQFIKFSINRRRLIDSLAFPQNPIFFCVIFFPLI